MNWKLSLRLLVAVLTFIIGVTITFVWMTRKTPNLEQPNLEQPTLEQPSVTRMRCFPGLGQKIGSLKAHEGGYFPEFAFPKDELVHHFFSFYTGILVQMNEPSLLSSDKPKVSYRFLWLRSFHPAVVVRVSSEGDKQTLSVKEFNDRKSQLLVDQTRSLNKQEWADLMKVIDQTCFWVVPGTTDDLLANDGALWVLEGVDQNYYHVVTRQSPQSGPYRELCLYMLKLSGLPLTEREIY